MIVDPVQALKTSSLLVPTATGLLPSITPLPSVVPDLPEYQHVHDAGKKTLWVVFVIMTVASAVFAGMAWTVPLNKRVFHYITTVIVMTAAMSYFAMATGHGVTYHHIIETIQHEHVPDTTHDVYRQVFYARYIDWCITTPLLLLDLGLVAGMQGGYIIMAITADIIMILTGLFAAFGSEGTPQKWGWYTIACIAYLVILWHLILHGRACAMQKGDAVAKFFGGIAGLTVVLWTAYPIVWGIADGARHLSLDAEIIAYAILDVLAKVGFGAWLLATHMKMPEVNIDMGGFWSYGLNQEGRLRVGEDDEGA